LPLVEGGISDIPVSRLEHFLIIANDIARGGRPIHHVAFRASGLMQTLSYLASKGVTYIEQQAGTQNLYQVFLQHSNGITVELNFPAKEADGLKPPKLALAYGEKE